MTGGKRRQDDVYRVRAESLLSLYPPCTFFKFYSFSIFASPCLVFLSDMFLVAFS